MKRPCYLVATDSTFGLDNFKHLAQYQGQYGDYVRLGPADLSVADPDAVQPVLGPASKCKKSEHYDAQLPLVSMHSTRDKAMHDKRRRVWDKGFNAKGIVASKPLESRLLTWRSPSKLRTTRQGLRRYADRKDQELSRKIDECKQRSQCRVNDDHC